MAKAIIVEQRSRSPRASLDDHICITSDVEHYQQRMRHVHLRITGLRKEASVASACNEGQYAND